MDQTHEYSFQKQKSLSLSQFIKSQFLKRVVTKLIVTVSLFSILFSHPTLHSCLHYFNFYFSTFPMKLFSHTLDKNCTFLLCNGLLVFLAKYSGLFSSSSKYNLTDHESFKNYEDDSLSQVLTEKADQLPLLEKETEVESTKTQQNSMEGRENEYKSQEVLETETEKLIEKVQEEQQEEEIRDVLEENEEPVEGSFFIAEAETREVDEKEAEEEEEEEGNWLLSTDELKKKFDDFIRKKKEELRIEARQQPIMV